jgi:hypothetical protein
VGSPPTALDRKVGFGPKFCDADGKSTFHLESFRDVVPGGTSNTFPCGSEQDPDAPLLGHSKSSGFPPRSERLIVSTVSPASPIAATVNPSSR